jgi:hypothetical protein
MRVLKSRVLGKLKLFISQERARHVGRKPEETPLIRTL